jgi:hypothetical protein
MIKRVIKYCRNVLSNPSLLKEALYSQRSNYLLNYLTLSIRDEEINLKLREFRLDWLDRIYYYGKLLLILNLLWCFIQQFVLKSSHPINLVMAANTTLIFIIWAALRVRLKRFTPIIPVLFLLCHAVEVNLIFRDQVSPILRI